MKKPDLLKDYLKELPREEPSINFTGMVMSRVCVETVKSPVVYQPLISIKEWRNIIIASAIILLVSIFLYFYLPGSQTTAGLFSMPKIDYSFIFRPFVLLSQNLNKLSFTYVAVLMAVSALLIFDQIHSRLNDL